MWTCPKCTTKVDDHFDVCWNCGTTREGVEDPNFVKADDAPPIEDPLYDSSEVPDPALAPATEAVEGPGGELVEAYQAFSLIEAKFIADQLNAAGIPAITDTQDLQDQLGVLDGNPRVWVRAADYERARAWTEAYDARREAGGAPESEAGPAEGR